MRIRLALISAPLPLFVAAALHAQAPAGGGAGGHALTLERFVARRTARIMAADTDGDGRISRAEMAAAAAGRGGRDPARRFDAMDANHDGTLDKDEIRAALTRRFRRMDRNGDGVVTPDERMAVRQRSGHAATAAPQP